MMRVFGFSYGENDYAVEASFDDAAIMDNTLAIDVVAKCTNGDENISVAARIEILPWENIGRIAVEGQDVFTFSLIDPAESGLEQFIQNIPVPEPILGCALKAGVSSIIGQAVRCRRMMDAGGSWGKIYDFVDCMRKNIGRIGLTALKRAFGCMISGGLI